jgi:hypothetical protein
MPRIALCGFFTLFPAIFMSRHTRVLRLQAARCCRFFIMAQSKNASNSIINAVLSAWAAPYCNESPKVSAQR